ncbi:uncharacterized protein LOC133525233 [Cydia pomonella]|uniref:uncharacterized protein LOC133525233 n=1 Tax=Cydia pomonella TaxID=82600 RepID=UPI002ADE3529|nr:uncharacterized protein LOC133525233 [Cydia pomonella]
MPTIPRRRKNPIELEEAGKTMKEAMSSLNKVLNKPQQSEDDYDRYGKILANKLRKLSETESLQMMYEIDGLFIRRLPSISPHNIQPSSASGYAAPYYQRRPSSTCTSYSEPARIQVSLPSTSPHNIRPSSASGSYSVLRDTYEIATEPPTIRILSNQIVNQPIAPEISESNNISDILSRALYEA